MNNNLKGQFICKARVCEIGEFKLEAEAEEFNDSSKNTINISISHRNFQVSHEKICHKISVRGEKRDEQKKEIALKGIQNCVNLNAIFNQNAIDPSE